MRNPFKYFKKLTSSLGLVEQSQIVASTAVIVLMITIVGIFFSTTKELRWNEFFTLISVGIFGFLIVYFITKYGYQINLQQRQLIALNTIAESVGKSVELDVVLQTSLEKVCELLGADYGWIYLVENNSLELKYKHNIKAKSLPDHIELRENTFEEEVFISDELKKLNINTWSYLPLENKGEFSGVLIIASKHYTAFKPHKMELLQAFGNHISLAIENAYLFKQLKESEKLYADLYENLPDMYHSVKIDGTVVSSNRTEVEFLGYTQNEIIGNRVTKLYPDNQHAAVLERIKNIFEEKKELKGFEEIMCKKDGSIVDVSINTSLVYNEIDEPVLLRVVARDITNQKKMEQKIIQAQKIDSIGNLAGGVAHDFNNILNSILGPASMMKRKLKEDDSFYKYMNLIEDAARRGAAVTRQLLAFSRKSNVYFNLVDVNKIVTETVELFERSVPKSIRINWKPSKDLVIINADDGQIEQALMNLLINAQYAMQDGGVISITCRTINLKETISAMYSDVQPGKYVMLKVVDTGTGIPKEILPKIFEPFFTTKDHAQGTGLGLSVVYGVVKSHQGYISVESEIVVGTAFTIYLPQAEIVDKKYSKKSSDEIARGNERVLLVDDDAGANMIGGDILKELGYMVEIARDGYQALEKFGNNPEFDLVILDLNMPGISGKEVFYKLKKINPFIKVLICSGYSDTIINDDDFIKSINGYLHKPYMYEELATTVRSVLDQEKNAN